MDLNSHEKDNILSERKKLILKAIVEAHVEIGEPVGSKYLTTNKQIAFSSATIRNEMAELEIMGYLEQPHTSAGRVPTELGYRLYVDTLAERYRLTENEIAELKSNLQIKQSELDSMLDTAVKLASKLTDFTALAIKPRQTRITISRFEILTLDENTLVLVMILGQVIKTKYIRSGYPVAEELAPKLTTILNTHITGLTSTEITIPIMMQMEREMGEYDFVVAPVVKAVCETIATFDGGDLKFDGINRLLEYPEYYDLRRLRKMLELFEKKDDLLEALSNGTFTDLDDNKVKIYIGRENLVDIMNNSTMIYKSIKKNGIPVGAVGIIGPTRMNYRRVIAMIDSLSDGITNLITDGKVSEQFGNDV